MSQVDRVNYVTRERATSTDQNRATQLHHRALLEGLHGMTSVTGLRRSGILHGFDVQPVPGQMQVTVSPGLGLMRNAANLYPTSQWQWMELQDTTVVNCPASGAQARWDIVEVRPGQTISSTQGRDIFNPNLGTFSQSNVTKEYKSLPEFQVRSGAESFNPVLPDGTSGWMPIGYLGTTAGDTEIDGDEIVRCRPLLIPTPLHSEPIVQGGGVEITAEGSTGTLHAASGMFPDRNLPFTINEGTTVQPGTPQSFDGGTPPVVDSVIYVYAIPPPYPTGYDADLAPREIQRNVAMSGVQIGQKNCVVVGSTNAPTLDMQGAPSIGGTTTKIGDLWGTGDNSLSRSNWIYLGACFFDSGGFVNCIQRTLGAHVSPQRKTGFDFEADLPIVGATPKNLWSNIAGDSDMQLPVTARKCECSFQLDHDAGGTLRLQIEDYWTGSSQLGRVCIIHSQVIAGTQRGGGTHMLVTDASGNVSLQSGDANLLNGNARVHVRAYEDLILALR